MAIIPGHPQPRMCSLLAYVVSLMSCPGEVGAEEMQLRCSASVGGKFGRSVDISLLFVVAQQCFRDAGLSPPAGCTGWALERLLLAAGSFARMASRSRRLSKMRPNDAEP
ncbi:unnamed protein product [Ostreobium quekettii]|uniref:Secreted protein n=1 Tax=Ostreobium quekettii TaxID=121088 RepID=A0A8S1ILM5_9CHLO|nr:unnamed protein product [Ostreobium quekettii]